jgi:uncharacterized membrane protein
MTEILKSTMASLQLPHGWWPKFVLLGLAAFFINVGVDHFVNPGFYLSIMPPALPLHLEAVYISGFFEIAGGIGLLIPRLRVFAGWGLIALLVAVYPANIYMLMTPEAFPDIPIEFLWLRMPFQFLFAYWAYVVTRPSYNPGPAAV